MPCGIRNVSVCEGDKKLTGLLKHVHLWRGASHTLFFSHIYYRQKSPLTRTFPHLLR